MKAEITENINVTVVEPTFEPLTLTIEIETKEDLIELYHRLNFNGPVLHYGSYCFGNEGSEGEYEVWDTVDMAVREAGLKEITDMGEEW